MFLNCFFVFITSVLEYCDIDQMEKLLIKNAK